jgi:hypothetical protein
MNMDLKNSKSTPSMDCIWEQESEDLFGYNKKGHANSTNPYSWHLKSVDQVFVS